MTAPAELSMVVGNGATELWADESGGPVWRLAHETATPKPHVHPLSTLAGHCLTDSEPPDHPWHRGLWFAVKYVNGDNFWEEEEPPFGTQVVSSVVPRTNGAGPSLALDVDWRHPRYPQPVIHEQRLLACDILDDRVYFLDWTTQLLSHDDLLLERTPYAVQAPRNRAEWPGGPPFPAWGGYGGLVVRAAPDLDVAGFGMADDARGAPPLGARAAWCSMFGALGGAPVTLAIVDHPSNHRFPSPWYGGSNGRLLNAALLFEEPLVLWSGRPLKLRYRVVVADGHLSQPELSQVASSFYVTSEEGE